jgi:hypothetical protein
MARGISDVVKLRWRLGFSFESKLAWGRCTRAYIVACEESGWIKIQVRDKIRV